MARYISMLAVIGFLAGCGGTSSDPNGDAPREATTAEKPLQSPIAKRLSFVANKEMKQLAIQTCRVVPRSVLVAGFGAGRNPDQRPFDTNTIALMYAGDVDISPIRLQEAAATGCRIGLRRQAAPR